MSEQFQTLMINHVEDLRRDFDLSSAYRNNSAFAAPRQRGGRVSWLWVSVRKVLYKVLLWGTHFSRQPLPRD